MRGDYNCCLGKGALLTERIPWLAKFWLKIARKAERLNIHHNFSTFTQITRHLDLVTLILFFDNGAAILPCLRHGLCHLYLRHLNLAITYHFGVFISWQSMRKISAMCASMSWKSLTSSAALGMSGSYTGLYTPMVNFLSSAATRILAQPTPYFFFFNNCQFFAFSLFWGRRRRELSRKPSNG